MNGSAGRIKKEAHLLFWPWSVLLLAGILSWLPFGPDYALYSSGIYPIGLWIGFSLLATLSLGNEFQHGTVPLLLSQPVARMKIWLEKWIVLSGAVLTAALVYLLPSVGDSWHDLTIPALWILITVCSAGFWVLIAKSTIGGLVLNILQGIGLMLTWNIIRWVFRLDFPGILLIAAALVYSFLVLWLSSRMLKRFQAISGHADDLLMTSPMTRGSWARFFQCQPTGAILNLIRKEVRILWPVWVLIAACLFGVACLASIQLLPGVSDEKLAVAAPILVLVLISLSTVLAGSLSMGEERTSGTHSWHQALPVSADLQWFVKLAVAIVAAVIGPGLALLLGRLTFGSAFIDTGFGNEGTQLLLGASALACFAAFWCACAVRGTVRAVLWVFPAASAVLSAKVLGGSIGESFRTSQILEEVILRWHPFPFSREPISQIYSVLRLTVPWLLGAPLLLALIQTRRLFRREIPDNLLYPVRYLLPVMLMGFLIVFVLRLPFAVVHVAGDQLSKTIYDTHEAVGKLPIDIAKLDATQPVQITVNDLSKVAPLSDAARILLRGSTISVRPKGGDPKWFDRHQTHTEYFTTIRFRNNWECTAYGGPYFRCTTPEGWFGSPTQP